MRHVDAVETTPLPDPLERELDTGARCVAVVVDSTGGEPSHTDSGADRAAAGRPTRRASASIFRVGDGYVLKCNDADGGVGTVAMRADQLEEYLERVRHDDAWTYLSVAEGMAVGDREPARSEFQARG
jgi:hypothetical protein